MPKNNLTTWKGLQRGTKFRVVRNSNGHSYPTGRILTLSRDGEHGTSMNNCAKEISGNNLNVSDIELVWMSIEDMRLEKDYILNKQEENLKKLELSIEFCEKYGLEHYEDRYLDSFEILKIAQDTKTSEMDKIKAIIGVMTK